MSKRSIREEVAELLRNDFVRGGKTRKPKCKPPNKICGNRCIPPNWDCRLKGEGADPQLRAVQTDPLSGLANIERGVKRIGKGLAKGSFSDIEGGRNAIIRGTVKTIPANMKQKQQIKQTLTRNTAKIGLALTVITGGILTHNVLKSKWDRYGEGLGRDIDNAVRNGYNAGLDRIPIIGPSRVRARGRANAVAQGVLRRATLSQIEGPEGRNASLYTTAPGFIATGGMVSGAPRNMAEVLTGVDELAKGGNGRAPLNYTNWATESRDAFLSARGPGRTRPGSAFAEPATQEFLANQFGFRTVLSGDVRRDEQRVKRLVEASLRQQATILRTDASNLGFNLDARGDARNVQRAEYVSGLVRRQFSDLPPIQAGQMQDRLLGLLNETNYKAASDRLYADTRRGFETFYENVYNETRSIPQASIPAQSRDLVNAANLAHAQHLANNLPALRGARVVGPGHAEIIRRTYYGTRVNRQNAIYATDREISLAASELTGRTDPIGPADGLRILREEYGFSNLARVNSAAGRAAQRSTATLADLLQERNPDGTLRFATREAAERELRRRQNRPRGRS